MRAVAIGLESLDGEHLADTLALSHAVTRPQHAYQAEWYRGMAADLNYQVTLTDPRERLDRVPARVVGWRLPAAGPELTFEVEG